MRCREVRLGARDHVAPARIRYERARTDGVLHERPAAFGARDDQRSARVAVPRRRRMPGIAHRDVGKRAGMVRAYAAAPAPFRLEDPAPSLGVGNLSALVFFPVCVAPSSPHRAGPSVSAIPEFGDRCVPRHAKPAQQPVGRDEVGCSGAEDSDGQRQLVVEVRIRCCGLADRGDIAGLANEDDRLGARSDPTQSFCGAGLRVPRPRAAKQFGPTAADDRLVSSRIVLTGRDMRNPAGKARDKRMEGKSGHGAA